MKNKTEEFKEATSRQYWALKAIFDKDMRSEKLSFDVASQMIKDANEKSGFKKEPSSKIPTILQYLANQESIEKLKNSIIDEIGIKSVLVDNLDENGKKYIFLGTGCGFSWVVYDKRKTKVKFILEKAGEVRQNIDELVKKNIDTDVINYLTSVGNPIQALQAQSMVYKNTYNQLIVDYLKIHFNIEDIYVDSRLD